MPRCYMVKKACNKYQGLKEEPETVDEDIREEPSAAGPGFYRPISETEYTYVTAESIEGADVTASSPAEVTCHDGGIPIFRLRSVEETEAAHDLLELSRSLPPLPAPGVTAHYPSAPNENIYPPPSAAIYHCCGPSGDDVRYSAPAPQPAPLTPPNSEYSSDAENNNPNPQGDSAPQTSGAVYTYDALLVTDGRSKNRKDRGKAAPIAAPSVSKVAPLSPTSSEDAEIDDVNCDKGGRYTCSECGKKYATSSNLSRHKQTHRSLDSQSAKKCNTCGKAYVSMPALAMHLLTHKLSHACGICGKLFSRPWLLQGHLRSHTGEKPYGCAHCGKAFADRSNLRAHMQTHSADKNYQCSRCRKTFALKSYLNKHLESACVKEEADSANVAANVAAATANVKVVFETVRNAVQVQ